MKKFLFVALAALGLTACMQNEELAAPKGDAIQFDNAFVENSVRAAVDSSYTNAYGSLTSFNVWGRMSKGNTSVNIFQGVDNQGVEVSKESGVWAYAPQYTQYWIDGYTYNFAAVVGAESVEVVDGMPATISVDMAEQKDVLYAVADTRTYSADNGNSSPVSFTFQHLLAKAKFTVNNAIATDSGFGYTISSIKIKETEGTATYTVNGGWNSSDFTNEINFGGATNGVAENECINLLAGDSAESHYVRYLVPGENKTLNIEVTCALKLYGTTIEENITKNVTAVLDVEAGCAYNLLLSFGNPGQDIDFSASVEGWIPEGGHSVSVAEAELRYYALNGGDYTLTQNIKLASPVIVAEGKTLNLNLGGYEITTTYDSVAKKHIYALTNNGTLTLSNGTITSRGIYNYGTLTLADGAVVDACDGNGGYGIYNFGTFVMNGGEVKTSLEDDNLVDQGGYDATTIRNENGGQVTINGGVVNNICDYTFAIDNQSGGTVTVNGGTITSIHSTISNYGTLTVNGGTMICDGLEGITAHVLVAWGNSTTTINGGKFNGKDNYNGFNIDAVAGATVYVKGGEFLSVHSGSLYGDGSIIVSGGTFFDEIASSRLAPGCELQQTTNGTWTVVEGPGYYTDANGNYHITSAKGWLWMADQVDSFFRNKTVYLDNDIDFAGKPIRVTRMYYPEYFATFDGQNHTVSNVYMADGYDKYNQALFDGHMNIKNLTVVDSHVYGMGAVGIIGANIYGTIDNCHVKRCRSYGYVWQVGGIVGLHSSGEIKNCSVEDTKVECYYYGAVGAIAGCMNDTSRNVTGCTVKNCTLIKEGPEGVYPDYDPMFGVVVGYAVPIGTYVFDCDVENVTIKGVASSQLYGEVPAGSTVNGVQL